MILTSLFLIVWNSYCKADIQTYNMEDYCNTGISMILDSVYQLKLQLDDIHIFDKNLKSAGLTTCKVKIEPWYTWPNLMLYFESFDLDCNLGYLQFFQSTSNGTRVKGLEEDICGDEKPSGIFTLETDRYLQITYVPKRSQYVEDVVSIIITSYASAPCPVHGFECDNSRCIDREIRCDGYDSCGDGSGCKFSLSSVAVAGIIVSSMVGLFILITLAICVVCCMRKKRKTQSQAQHPSQHGVVYTATRNDPVTLRPPAYNSSQCDQPGMYGASSSNQESYHAPVLPLNVTAGQKPAYPPNWTMPSYQLDNFRNPPPYEQMHDTTTGENVPANLENAPIETGDEIDSTENEENKDNNQTENVEYSNTSDAENKSNTDQEQGVRLNDAVQIADATISEPTEELASTDDTINCANTDNEATEAGTMDENNTDTKAESTTNVLTECESVNSNSVVNSDPESDSSDSDSKDNINVL